MFYRFSMLKKRQLKELAVALSKNLVQKITDQFLKRALSSKEINLMKKKKNSKEQMKEQQKKNLEMQSYQAQ